MGKHSILDTFTVLYGLMDLSIIKYNNFIDRTSDSTLQLFKKNTYQILVYYQKRISKII